MLFLPVKFSFYADVDTPEWDILDYCTDFIFFLDLIVTFFTPYYNGDTLVTNLKSICCNYLKLWFWLDFLSIFPFELIFITGNYVSLIRLSRFPKVYRLVKISKIIRSLKNSNSQNNIWSELHNMLRLNPSINRAKLRFRPHFHQLFCDSIVQPPVCMFVAFGCLFG